MDVRWSITSFIGTERTEVAVGTDSEVSMFLAVRMGAPRSTVYFGSAVEGSGRTLGLGVLALRLVPVPGLCGALRPLVTFSTAGLLSALAGAVSLTGAFAGALVAASRCLASGDFGRSDLVSAFGSGLDSDLGAGLVSVCGWACGFAGDLADGGAAESVVFGGEPSAAKNSRQVASTDCGSASYASRISSMSQELAPKRSLESDADMFRGNSHFPLCLIRRPQTSAAATGEAYPIMGAHLHRSHMVVARLALRVSQRAYPARHTSARLRSTSTAVSGPEPCGIAMIP